MDGVQACTVPMLVVRSDGSVGLRMGEATKTPGLFVVADCQACAQPPAAAEHVHRRWRVQTVFGYLVGDLGLTSWQDAHAAAASLGELELDWTDARLAVDQRAESIAAAQAVLSRWGLARAVA
jgi:hypothetical protein